MIIKKGNNLINSIKDWESTAPPKAKGKQWVEGRSAYELARLWVGTNKVSVPESFTKLFQPTPKFQNIIFIEGEPEAQLRFDKRSGEPRNADLAIMADIDGEKAAITIEAKADEPFGKLLPDAAVNALERKLTNHNSQGMERIVELIESILPSDNSKLPGLNKIRYQLLTGIAGTIAYARDIKSNTAVFIIQEFKTSKTSDVKIQLNTNDLNNFVDRLSNGSVTNILPDKLYGPFKIPGKPLFEEIPDLYIGKIRTV